MCVVGGQEMKRWGQGQEICDIYLSITCVHMHIHLHVYYLKYFRLYVSDLELSSDFGICPFTQLPHLNTTFIYVSYTLPYTHGWKVTLIIFRAPRVLLSPITWSQGWHFPLTDLFSLQFLFISQTFCVWVRQTVLANDIWAEEMCTMTKLRQLSVCFLYTFCSYFIATLKSMCLKEGGSLDSWVTVWKRISQSKMDCGTTCVGLIHCCLRDVCYCSWYDLA